jgi:hypothetical protein
VNENEIAMEKQSENDDCVGTRWNFVPIEQVDRMKSTIAN